MIKIPTAQQIRELDSASITEMGIKPIDLMERAAAAVAQSITGLWPSSMPVLVLAGPGNNGGDALAVARLLSSRGYTVEAFLFNTSDRLSPDCQTNRERLKSCTEVKFTEVTAQFEPPRQNAGKLIIDGLFGTGLNKPLNRGFASLVQFINESGAEIVSIDLPSGIMADGTLPSGQPTVHAHHTFTFQVPKLAMMLADTAVRFGEVHILDIGLSRKAMDELNTAAVQMEKQDVSQLFMPRPAFSHKGTYGHALIIAGKYGMAGAAVLAARACLRSGVGKVTVASPQMNNAILQVAVPEAIISLDPSDTVFSAALPLEAYDAVAIGPGIGTDRTTANAFFEQMTRCTKPLVIDADGLNIMAQHAGWTNRIPRQSIITPHPGELARLCHHPGMDSCSALTAACEMATRQSIYVVLKGHRTAICMPDGSIVFNSTGNSGMATAGSGDVLTGCIAALLAQGYPPRAACMAGVYVHGMAGDLAAAALSEESLVASDIIGHLPAAFRHLREQKQLHAIPAAPASNY